jgi:hypothetical protein
MKKLLLGLCLVTCTAIAQAQVGIGTATPDASAQLDISSSNKGILIPRVTQANRPASPVKSLLIYQTDGTPGFYYYNGLAWKMLDIVGNNWTVNGNSTTGSNSSNFIGSTDGSLTFKASGQRSGLIDLGAGLTFFGFQAGFNNGSIYNTAFGYLALYTNVSGHHNTALGLESMLASNGGSYNTAMGNNSLYNNTIGSYNTTVGNNALSNNTTGSNNTAIGSDSGPNSAGLNNTTAVGNGAVVTTDNTIVVGNSSVTSIGGYTHWTVLSDIRFKKDISDEDHGLDFIMKLKPIIYHMDVQKLNQFLYGKKADSLFSSVSMKEGIMKKESILYSGFSAQQVEVAAQKIGYNFSGIHRPENEHDHYSLDYSSFVVPLVKAVQEQQETIEHLKKENEELKKMLTQIENSLSELKKSKQ